mmetsp:Transcript_33003/g.53838  ORF Transcript_33003/g.53838 Transcript_33003/m.53838 type:complete len:198 (-) Transcript_33003:168-761(-)
MRSFLLVALIVATLLHCGLAAGDPDKCDPLTCPNTDCGSCGGSACCKLQLWFKGGETEDIAQKLAESMKKGVDGTYELVETYVGDLGMSDLRARTDQDEDSDFVGQMLRYPDLSSEDSHSVSFSLQSRYGGVMLNVFSASSKAGAYCDKGQNYKNIVEFVDSLSEDYTLTHTDLSCFKYVPDGEVLKRLAAGVPAYS